MKIGTKDDLFVLTEEQRHILMDYKRSELLAWTPPRPTTAEAPPPPRELGEDADAHSGNPQHQAFASENTNGDVTQ